MSQYRCVQCHNLQNETEIVMVRKRQGGKIVTKSVCNECYSKIMPNPLRKKVTMLWVIIACLTGILSYLLAYRVF